MTDQQKSAMRIAFVVGLVHGIQIVAPVLSGLVVLIAALGAAVGMLEGWGVGNGLYFAAVSALTIGYGDLAPTGPLTKVITIAMGLLGIITTALLAGVAVAAVQAARAGSGAPGGM